MPIKCPKCDNYVNEGEAFCTKCGCNLSQYVVKKQKLSRTAILLIILGGLIALLFLLVGISTLLQPKAAAPSASTGLTQSVSRNKEVENKIADALHSHTITDYCEFVSVTLNGSDANIGISLQWYESYSFAAAVTVATERIKELKDDYGLQNVFLMVYTPEAQYKATWNSTDLEKGKLSDTMKGFDGWYTFDEMQKLYGYEGLLED